MNLSIENICYLAGVIDMESSIQIFKRKHSSQGYVYAGYTLSLNVSNTNLGLLQWLKQNLGGSVGAKKTYNPKCKQAYYWSLGGKETKQLLKKVYPYLLVKKEQAALALNFPFGTKSEFNISLKDKLFEEIKILNKRGVALGAEN